MIRNRVVCGRGETMVTFRFKTALRMADFPTLGLPTIPTNPAREEGVDDSRGVGLTARNLPKDDDADHQQSYQDPDGLSIAARVKDDRPPNQRSGNR